MSLDNYFIFSRIAEALERMAAADERRNELLVEDAEVRKAAWERELESRADQVREYIAAVKEAE